MARIGSARHGLASGSAGRGSDPHPHSIPLARLIMRLLYSRRLRGAPAGPASSSHSALLSVRIERKPDLPIWADEKPKAAKQGRRGGGEAAPGRGQRGLNTHSTLIPPFNPAHKLRLATTPSADHK